MNQALTALRLAHRSDVPAMTELHRASIRHYCVDHYPPDVIEDWVRPIKVEDYQDAEQHSVVVAERSDVIVGFAVLKLDNPSIDKLYIAPFMGKQGIGSLLLSAIERMAREHGIDELSLSSTLNAVSFYEHHGYHKKSLTPSARAMDNMLGCISMGKRLGSL